MVPAFEIMIMTPAISNLIRDNKTHQIEGMIYTSAKDDMLSMDSSLLQLYKAKKHYSRYCALLLYQSGDAQKKAIRKEK